MPKGIITQFIVAMHKYIDQQKYVWKSGVILNKDQTKAEVIEYYDKREIKIRVAGRHKRDILTEVTYELDKIHNSYKALEYSKLIPCNCQRCKDSQEPYFYRFDVLRKFVADRQYRIQCQESYQMINVLGLIYDVIDSNQLNEKAKGDGIEIYSQHIPDILELARLESSRPITVENKFVASGGNTYQQSGTFGIGHMSGGTIEEGAQVAAVINEPQPKKLAEVAAEIQNLLNYFEQNNPTIIEAQQMVKTATERQPELKNAKIIEEAIQATPTLKQRLRAAGEAAYVETVKMLFPPVGVAIEAFTAWNNPE